MTQYEIHITVDHNQFILVKKVCLLHSIKYIFVKNDKGDNPFQLIITKWVNVGSNEQAIEEATKLSELLREEGLTTLRDKVEMELISDTNIELAGLSEYFEFHIKVLVNLEEYLLVEEVSKKHNAYLSIGIDKEVYLMPYISLRFHSITREEALKRKDSLIEDIKLISKPIRVHQELCFYDTNEDLDKGWI